MIPDFDHNGVLPPHTGDPRVRTDMSPYPVAMLEVVKRFGISAERRVILAGLLQMRADMRAAGIAGFQWLDGSFCQDIEAQEGRPPGDIDVVIDALNELSKNDGGAAVAAVATPAPTGPTGGAP